MAGRAISLLPSPHNPALPVGVSPRAAHPVAGAAQSARQVKPAQARPGPTRPAQARPGPTRPAEAMHLLASARAPRVLHVGPPLPAWNPIADVAKGQRLGFTYRALSAFSRLPPAAPAAGHRARELACHRFAQVDPRALRAGLLAQCEALSTCANERAFLQRAPRLGAREGS